MHNLVRLFLVIGILSIFTKATGAERTTYFVPNALGSPVAAMDEQGNVIWRESYSPYGERRSKAANNDAKVAYTGKPEEIGTGLVYMGGRWYDPESARFTGIDPVKFYESNLQSFNRYAYGANSPYVYVDPDGRDVTIAINRTTYTDKTVIGTISVTSDKTDKTFSGYTLENTKAGDKHDKLPIPEGTYGATMRKDHDPNRVELKDVEGYSNIQIHIGNTADDVKGCLAPGKSTSKDAVGESRAAMTSILEIIDADKSDVISVSVAGAREAPK